MARLAGSTVSLATKHKQKWVELLHSLWHQVWVSVLAAPSCFESATTMHNDMCFSQKHRVRSDEVVPVCRCELVLCTCTAAF